MPRGGDDIAENVHFILRFPKTQRKRVAHGQHRLHLPILNDGQMTNVIYAHQFLSGPHGVVGSTTHNPGRHDVTGPDVLHFAPVGSGKGPNQVSFGNDANHARAKFANGHRANLMRVHALRHSVQKIVRQTGDESLL